MSTPADTDIVVILLLVLAAGAYLDGFFGELVKDIKRWRKR